VRGGDLVTCLPADDPLEGNPYDLVAGEDYEDELDFLAGVRECAFIALTIVAFMSFAWFLA
jgi:hypothetical protein